MPKAKRTALSIAAVLMALALSRNISKADSVSEFYHGRTIYALVGLTPGGGADLNLRLVARHLGRFIPGHPNIIPQNMVGAAGMVMANYLSKVAPKDGTYIGMLANSLPGRQAVGLDGVQYDAQKLQWLGSAAPGNVEVLIVSKRENISNIDELKQKEVAVGSNGAGGISSSFPHLLNDVLGTRMKVVEGYTGSPTVDLAMERGEVGGRNHTFSGLLTSHPEWLESGDVKILVYAGDRPKGMPDNAPSLASLLKTDAEVAATTIVLTGSRLGFPFAVNPDVPKERVAALREAFAEMVQDPEFIADARTARLELGYIPYTGINEIINSLFSQKPDDLQRAKRYFQ